MRLFVVILMTLLLPVRGAVAAAMLCPNFGDASPTVVDAAHDHHGMHGDQATHDHAAGSHHHDDTAAGGANSHDPHPGTCNACASGCCSACMVGPVLSMAHGIGPESAVFPPISAPAPHFQADGQERPPRTI